MAGFLGPLAQMGLVGIVVILLIVLAFIAGGKRISRAQNDEERADTEDRMEEAAQAGRERERVAFRDKPKRFPLTTKLLFLGVFGFLAILAYGMFTYAQTGGPSSMAFATELTAGTYGLILIAAGIWVARKQDAKAGELTTLYEQEDANHQETFYYERERTRKVTYVENGTERTALILPLFRESRYFGLFWTRLLSADRDELKDRDHRRPEDRVLVRVELGDPAVTWDQDSQEITVRASEKADVDDPNKHWDYEFVPSKRRSEAEVQKLQQDKEELQQLVRNQARRIGILSENMEELSTMLENADHFGSQRLQETFDTAMQMALGLDAGQMEMNQVSPDDLAGDRPRGVAHHPQNGQQSGQRDDSSAD